MVDWCCMCKRSGENLDHLLLHCSFARELSEFVCDVLRLVSDAQICAYVASRLEKEAKQLLRA